MELEIWDMLPAEQKYSYTQSAQLISQTGCIGMCRLEPMVDVYVPGSGKVTYVHMTPEKVARVVAEHIVNGRPVAEYTIGAAEDKKSSEG